MERIQEKNKIVFEFGTYEEFKKALAEFVKASTAHQPWNGIANLRNRSWKANPTTPDMEENGVKPNITIRIEDAP